MVRGKLRMSDVVIASAVRTPVGAFLGGLSSVSASYLGAAAIKEALKRAKVEGDEVDEATGSILLLGKAKTRRGKRRLMQDPL